MVLTNTEKTSTKIMSESIVLFKNVSGAYVAVGPEGKTICSTWDREHADSALRYHIATTDPNHKTKVEGTWE